MMRTKRRWLNALDYLGKKVFKTYFGAKNKTISMFSAQLEWRQWTDSDINSAIFFRRSHFFRLLNPENVNILCITMHIFVTANFRQVVESHQENVSDTAISHYYTWFKMIWHVVPCLSGALWLVPGNKR